MVEWLIRTVMALHTEACTVVKTYAGLSERFEVTVSLLDKGMRVNTEKSKLCKVYSMQKVVCVVTGVRAVMVQPIS